MSQDEDRERDDEGIPLNRSAREGVEQERQKETETEEEEKRRKPWKKVAYEDDLRKAFLPHMPEAAPWETKWEDRRQRLIAEGGDEKEHCLYIWSCHLKRWREKDMHGEPPFPVEFLIAADDDPREHETEEDMSQRCMEEDIAAHYFDYAIKEIEENEAERELDLRVQDDFLGEEKERKAREDRIMNERLKMNASDALIDWGKKEIEDDAAEFESDIRLHEEMQRQENVRIEKEHMDIVEWEAQELRQVVNWNPEYSEWY